MAASLEPRPSMLGQVSRLADILLRMLHTRLEMFSAELVEQREQIAARLKATIIMYIAGTLAGFAAVLWIALAFPEDIRLVAMGVLVALFVVIAVVAYFRARQAAARAGGLPFGALLKQLQMDRDTLAEALRRPAAAKGVRPATPLRSAK